MHNLYLSVRCLSICMSFGASFPLSIMKFRPSIQTMNKVDIGKKWVWFSDGLISPIAP